ncbi:hypothetical protein BDA96_09G231600 [Sorghum bicolor]|uniref:non-specific serine/threonine protein kinase n=2 Tax=Sorghum bicolor TaxID=4558 RepID=A0A921QC84_SORBI|nr:hypothetical protein BDA96_09G231600 [Sorghum bicolor]KXG22467.1 hypothetical protein SORBI_3009G219100 [Sorghum bicolor]
MAASGLGLSTSFLPGHDTLLRRRRRRPASPSTASFRPVTAELGGVAAGLGRQLVEAVGVGLPCTVMQCGDVIYRSTLPQNDGLTITAPGVALALAAVSYLWATPGVAPGFFDMFVLAFAERLFRPTFRKEFPYNVETKILGNVQDLPKGIARENKIIQTVMRQLLFALDGLHSTGIVHRDIKPQNVIFSEGSRTFKIIDLGAAADLRVGINYIPKEFLLDPRYAAPEQYIMSTQTPSAPSVPVATTLSPVLWQLNLPDRFDIYSLGLIFLQMAFPSLRTDSSLIQFNRQLKRCDYDLQAWRNLVEPRATAELRRGFDIMDLDNGIGWELLTSMVRYKARQRTSAEGALAHPYFNREGLLGLSVMQNARLQLFRATQKDYSEAARWVIGLMARSGTEEVGGFTEAQLQELREIKPKKGNAQRNVLASVLRLQKKIVKTINESMDELASQRKSIWWSRWIPREE